MSEAIKILVATDGSPPAVAAGRAVARLLVPASAHVRLVTVLSYSLYPGSLVPGEHLPGEAQTRAADEDAIEAAVGEVRAIFLAGGHEVSVTHRFGNPRDEILAEVESWRPDLLVLGRRGVHGVERWLGSVSEHVVRHAHVPVFIAP